MAAGILVAVSTVISSIAKKVNKKREKRSADKAKLAPSWEPYFRKRRALMLFRGRRNKKSLERENSDTEEEERCGEGKERESGVWQKAILMGEKCQPPEFSGAIFYDYEGRRLSTMPKSPRQGSLVTAQS